MKNLKDIDFVKVAQISGMVLTLAGTALSSYVADKKLDKTIDDKVTKAIAEKLAEMTSQE